MKKNTSKQVFSVVMILFLLLSIVLYAGGEQSPWDCPACGRTGNTGKFCGQCGAPKPENASPEKPAAEPAPVSPETEKSGIISAECKYPTIVKGMAQEFTVLTEPDIHYLMLYAEDGKTLVKTWTAGENSTTGKNEQRTWTVSQIIAGAGNRKLVFMGGVTAATAETNAITVTFTVENTGILSAACKYPTIVKGGEQEFTVVTTADVQHLMLYAEDGKTLVQSWTAGESSAAGTNERTWTVKQKIASPGKRKLILRGGTAATADTNAVTVSFEVEETSTNIISAECRYPTIVKGSVQEFTVVTTADVQHLMLYAEDGKTLVKSWTAGENSAAGADGRRVWTVSQTIGSTGNRKLIFRGGMTAETADTNEITASFRVEDTGVISAEGKYTTIAKDSEQEFTVQTTTDVQYLMIYAEKDTLLTTWEADKYSTAGKTARTWKVSYKIKSPGSRELSFRAGITDAPTGAVRSVPFDVISTGVISAEPEMINLGKGGTQTVTVKTTGDANYLSLCSEDETTPVKQWKASENSTKEGGIRNWKISLSGDETVERKLTLRAGTDTASTAAGRAVTFTVAETKIFSAEADHAAIAKGGTQVFTIVTSSDIEKLMMYTENEKIMVSSWDARGNSTVAENNLRTWTVERKIKTAGRRSLVFKGGTTTRKPVTNSVKASFRVENTGVVTAERKYAKISKGSVQQFSVRTTSDINYLTVYAEDGTTEVKTWTANSKNSKINGNYRVWTVSLEIKSAGRRVLTFRGGETATPTDAEQSVSFDVQ